MDEVLAHDSAFPEEAERESLEDLAWLFEPPADDAPVDGFTPMGEPAGEELPLAFMIEDDPTEPGGYEEFD